MKKSRMGIVLEFFLPLIISLGLISSTLSFEIEKCRIEEPIKFQDSKSREISLSGYIAANLNYKNTHDVILVNNITFSGSVELPNQLTSYIDVKFDKIKSIRLQRILEYGNIGLKDSVRTQCTLTIINNYDRRMGIQKSIENQILRHAEYCIEKELCNVNSEDHRIGDDYFLIKSKSRDEPEQITSQETVNKLTDLILSTLMNSLVKANKTDLEIPAFKLSIFPITFSSSGGPVDVLSYMKRVEDFKFGYEGNRYTVSTALNLTGGLIQLNKVALSSPINNFVDGTLPVNMNQTNLRMKVAVDYSTKPCRVIVDEVSLTVPPNHVDFSILKIKFLGFEVTNVENILNTLNLKTAVINAIAGQLGNLLKNFVEEQKCEDYRDMLFELNKKL